MDKNTIVVAIESLPTDTLTQALPWATGIILPIALFFVSKTFASKAEKSANEFTIKLHKEGRLHLQKIRAIELLNEIYKTTHQLKRVSIKRKNSENFGQSILDINDKILASKNEQAIFFQQENLRNSAYRNDELEEIKSDFCINLHASIGQLSTIVGNQATSSLQTNIKSLTENAQMPGGITQDSVKIIVDEINSLSDRLISGEIEIESV